MEESPVEVTSREPDPGILAMLSVMDIEDGGQARQVSKEERDELRASVAQRGVLVPIIVVKTETGYRVVAGRRRLDAAREAGHVRISAVVIQHDEHTLPAIELIENLQRADLHPMDEAIGYDRMRSDGPKSIELVASMVGKSPSHVTRRLALLNLPTKAQEALRAGNILLGTAMQIARLPLLKYRELAFKAVMSEQRLRRAPMPEKDAREWIYRNVMLNLSSATWKHDDAELYPEAGACKTCPKRTGHEPALFDDLSEDLCLDGSCFDRKATLAWERRAKAHMEAGGEVIAGKEGAALFKYGHLQDEKTFVDAADRPWEDSKNRTFRQIVGSAAMPALVRDGEGLVHEVFRRSAIAEKLSAAVPKRTARGEVITPARAAAQKRERAVQSGRRAAAEAAITSIVGKVEAGSAAPEKVTRILLEGMLHGSWHDTLRDVVKRRGWSEKKSVSPRVVWRPEDAIRSKIASMKENALLGLAVECAITRFAVPQFQGDQFGKVLVFASKQCGLDLNKLASAHRAQALAALKAKPKGAKRKKAKASKSTK